MNVKTTQQNYDGDFNVLLDARTRITIRTSSVFLVEVKKSNHDNYTIVAPDSVTSRYAQLELSAGDQIKVATEGKTTYLTAFLPTRDEHPDPESLCEVVSDEKLSMYDRLKAEMFQKISAYAEERGLDTFEDDNDHSFEEDENLITTPYEYQAMQEEALENQPLPVADTSPAPIGEEQPPTISDPPTDSKPASE